MRQITKNLSLMKKKALFSFNLVLMVIFSPSSMTFAYSPGCIEVPDDCWLDKIRETAFGNPFSMALHPDGSIILGDHNNKRIVRLKDGNVTTVVATNNLKPGLAAVLPNGKIVYTTYEGQIFTIDIKTNLTTFVCQPPSGEWVSALATDTEGSIYFTTNLSNIYCAKENGVFFKIDEVPEFFDKDKFDNALIWDMAVTEEKVICVSGFGRAVVVKPDGTKLIVTDDLRYEPVFVTVSPDNFIYINDLGDNFIKYNPVTGASAQLYLENVSPFGDVLFPTADEIIVYEAHDLLYKYHLKKKTFTLLFALIGNTGAFAADGSDSVYFATPSKSEILDSHIVRLGQNGNIQNLHSLTYSYIPSIDVDSNNRLCIATSDGFFRQEATGKTTLISPVFFENKSLPWFGQFRLAVGPTGYWYTISAFSDDLIRVHRFSEFSIPTQLPITFNKKTFGDIDYEMMYYVSVDVGPDGTLAILVAASGIFKAPFYQRVFKADANGKNVREVANLDSNITGGPIDVAIGPDNAIFALSGQDENAIIYRIDPDGNIAEYVTICGGNDPASIDVDPLGSLWFCTTNGIYRVSSKTGHVLDWAESILPELLPVEGRTIYNQDGLYVRYYPGTGIYLGGYEGRLLYYQPDLSPDVFDLGAMDDYLPLAIEAGF